jgi:hypothetical protein
VIKRNARKYSISAQCKILGISRGSYYYEVKPPKDETPLEEAVQTAFEENRSLYGSPKLKKVLARKKINMPRRKICRIMKKRGLVSAYTRKKYKNSNKKVNEAAVPNLLERQFDGHERFSGECFNFSVIGFPPRGLRRAKSGKDFNTIGRIWLCWRATRAPFCGNSSNEERPFGAAFFIA